CHDARGRAARADHHIDDAADLVLDREFPDYIADNRCPADGSRSDHQNIFDPWRISVGLRSDHMNIVHSGAAVEIDAERDSSGDLSGAVIGISSNAWSAGQGSRGTAGINGAKLGIENLTERNILKAHRLFSFYESARGTTSLFAFRARRPPHPA